MIKYPESIADISLRQLEAFVVLAEELRFVHAARRLGTAQPPLSRLIGRLERTIGAPLFHRSSRGVRLTAVGATMLGPARRTLREARQAAESARRAAAGEAGVLTIGFSSSAVFSVLPGLLGAYRTRYPAVHLTLHEAVTIDQLTQVESGLLDIAIARGPVVSPGLAGTRLFHEPFLAVMPAEHRLAVQRRVSLSLLLRQRFVFIPRHVAPAFYDTILEGFRAARVSPVIAEEATEWHTIVGLVDAGLGVSIVPASLQRVGGPTVAFRPLTDFRVQAELVVAHRTDNTAPLIRGFMGVAREVARASR
ncbi:MAG: LysR family transcriptional regulator [Gemmatimonadales bacterium]